MKNSRIWGIAIVIACGVVAVGLLYRGRHREPAADVSEDAPRTEGEVSVAEADEFGFRVEENETTDTEETQTVPEPKSFEEIKTYLAGFSDDPREMAEEGCFVIGMETITGGIDQWNAFRAAVDSGREAEVVIVQFTVEGDPVLDYLFYNGDYFYHVADWSRDVFAGTQKYNEETFPYLKEFERVRGNGDREKEVVLTEDAALTLEKMEQIFATTEADNAGIRILAYWQNGNVHSDYDPDYAFHELATMFDESTALVPEEHFVRLVVVNALTGENKTITAEDEPEAFQKLKMAYYGLDVAPLNNAEESEYRWAYTYYMWIYDGPDDTWETRQQKVMPYHDRVELDDQIYDGSMNGTCTQLLGTMAGLDWQ